MQYVAALDEYRHFVRAADACGVSQSTLSTMIRNLEDELDVVIFDRTSHPVVPTEIGKKVIAQAKVVLFNAGQLSEIALAERSVSSGRLSIGVIPTVAPCILPQFFGMMKNYPDIELSVMEARTANIVGKLKRAEIDMAILATPLNEEGLLEIPLYYERFHAYISPEDPLYSSDMVTPASLSGENLWILQEGHCFRNQIENLCGRKWKHSMVYEAGSIDTLVKVVDMNGGHTIIPELHVSFLDDVQKQNIRCVSDPEPVREVSLVVRNDYVRERMLNIVADAVKNIIPDRMLDSRLKRFAIRI